MLVIEVLPGTVTEKRGQICDLDILMPGAGEMQRVTVRIMSKYTLRTGYTRVKCIEEK